MHKRSDEDVRYDQHHISGRSGKGISERNNNRRYRGIHQSGIKEKSLAGKLNGQEIDLRTPIQEDGAVEIITEGTEEGLNIMRHSTAHLLAQAIKRIYKDVKFGVGPVIENGFYYDVEMEQALTPDDLPKIEKK